MASRRVRKAVIPVAGLGTRFLPVTKVVPKELLPLVDRPIIHHIVEEVVQAGIENIIFITSRPKVLIEDYFDPCDLFSYKLREVDKQDRIEKTIQLSSQIQITSIRQYEPLGLGHAILQAAPAIGNEDFAVLLGDEVDISEEKNMLKPCLEKFQSEESGSVIGVQTVPHEDVYKYGVVEIDDKFKIEKFVEKPKPEETKSSWIIPGRYVFENSILDRLAETKEGKGGEIQLTDAMASSLKSGNNFWAQEIKGERFDTGNKLGFILANIACAMKSKEFRSEIIDFVSAEAKK